MKAVNKSAKWRLRCAALKRCRTLESVFACIVVIGLVTGYPTVPEPLQTPTPTEQPKLCTSEECERTASAILRNMNTEIKPCDNFYRFACGNYIKNTPIPDDKDSVHSFSSVSDKLRNQLNVIIKKERSESDPKYLRLLNALYRGCMKKDLIETLGPKPIEKLAKKIGGWPVIVGDCWNAKCWTWQNTVKELGRLGFGINYIVDVYVQVDIKNSTRHIITLDQSSTLLDHEYLKSSSSEPLDDEYFKYMLDMAVHFGADLGRARRELRQSLQFEKDLAQISWTRAERRNLDKMYNLRSIKQLQELYPYVQWRDYINDILPKGLKIKEDEIIILSVPSFFDGLGELLKRTNKRVIANYLMFRMYDYSADYLSNKFRKRKWQYTSAGEQKEGARWKQCAQTVLDSLPIAVGSAYVRQHFEQQAKTIALEMIQNIRNAFDKILDNAKWMDNITRNNAKKKLLLMTPLIGYPDEMLDNDRLEEYYSKLDNIDPDKYFESVLSINVFGNKNSFGKLKLPANKSDWLLFDYPHMAEAYYSPQENSIVFPAGILQGTFFNHHLPKYMNYGAIGSLIGHEITHGFDNKGRNFDADGNFSNWWKNSTAKAYLKKAQCIAEQYANYKDEQTGLKLNGNNTLDENIADDGGYKAAYLAYRLWLDKNEEPQLRGLENYTFKQMFWISAAQMWCANHNNERLEWIIRESVHSPKEFRVLGPLRNNKGFSRDFQCTHGTLMNPVEKCKFW